MTAPVPRTPPVARRAQQAASPGHEHGGTPSLSAEDERLLGTSPQALASIAGQHQTMPGATEHKHLEHEQHGTPPHTSKQPAQPAKQVEDENLGTSALPSASRGKGKGQGNKRQFPAIADSLAVMPTSPPRGPDPPQASCLLFEKRWNVCPLGARVS